jgi:flagellar biosynthesis GTPase FlhF
MGNASENELEERKRIAAEAKKKHEQEEMKLKEEKRKQAEQELKEREQEDTRKLKWYTISQSDLSSMGYDNKSGKIYCRRNDAKNNAVIIILEPGEDTLIQVRSNGKLMMLPAINSANKIDDIRKGVEKEFELLLAGKSYLTFW